MVSLKVLFGLVPKTAEYEASMDALKKEYQDLISFSQSKELADYLDLEKTVHSSDFELKKKQIQQQKFADTPEFRMEKEYLAQKKSKEIKQYYAVKDSVALKEYLDTDDSESIARYNLLDKYVQSPEFAEIKKSMEQSAAQKFHSSELYKTYVQYQELFKSARISGYYKMIRSKYFAGYRALVNTQRLMDFELLEKIVHSVDFETRKNSMSKADYKKTEDHAKLITYGKLKNARDIKNYQRFTKLPGFSLFSEMDGSKELKNFEKLQKEITGPDFQNEKKKIERQRFADTDAYRKLQEFNQLKKSEKIRKYFSFGASKLYTNYKRLNGSDTIARFEELEKNIASEAFRKVKEYMLLPGSKKYELSDEFKLEQQYTGLHHSEKFQWYFKIRNSKKFDEIKQWDLTFSDDFSSGIDSKKWILRYFWGDAVLNDTYALADEKHLFTDGKNLEVANGKLKIITKKERIKGKAWNPQMGFFTKEFDYTSGLISSGKSFRQQYGLFEAKIRFNRSYPVNHAFWMVSEQMLPHIDVIKCSKKMNFGNFWSSGGNHISKKSASTGSGKYTSDFFIYSLEWSKQKLIWKINGVQVMASGNGVPEAPMYINFNSGLYQDADGSVLPASMEIDWVRCYQHS
jgi:beta-glucanase (GH16 family)